MFFFLNLDLSYLRYQNVYFDITCADVVYPPGEKLFLFTRFAPMGYCQKYPYTLVEAIGFPEHFL